VQRIEQRDQARRRSERTQEIEEAREIQRGLLPRRIPQIPGMEVAASWQPARIVGGDYFDVLKFNGGTLGLAIGDVVGKGLPAALVMSNVQAAVKAVATAGLPPGELCARVNRLLCGNLSAGRFVTFFYGVVDAQRWTLTYANAGHVPPVLVRRDGFTARLRAGGAVLGEFPEWRYEQGTLPFAPGDRLALFTDGVTEARNAAGEEYGEARLTEFLRRHRGLRAEELRARLMEDVQRYCGSSFEDDATVLVVSVE
jgi:sigma-B regulation protein RsbU (phosphoserine phosphatase)